MSLKSSGEGRGQIGFQDVFFAASGLILLMAAGAAYKFRGHFQTANPRVQYGVEHLAGALAETLFFLLLMGTGRWVLARWKSVRELPTGYFVGAVVVIFCMFWLPAVLAGGFDRDDWMLLGAASVRKVLVGRPWLAWNTLDSVDGNFRPLGTVLYMGGMLRMFGVWARPFLLGLFAVNLLGSLTAFAIVRVLGYSRMAAAAGALLYLSRSETYTIMTWTCALGDALVILLCGLMALALLVAIRRRGWMAVWLHLVAWACFCLATLAKQSAFAAPLIVGLVLWLRPGTLEVLPPLMKRLRTAGSGVVIYGLTGAVPFFHAKHLLTGPPPYPIGFSFDAVLRVFGYAVWYLGTFEFPDRFVSIRLLPEFAGIAIVIGIGVAIWRVPRLLGERARDVIFCLLSAVASVSLFVVLPARVAPYYGSMAGFWFSLALGIALTRFGWVSGRNLAGRVCCFIFCVLVVVGFLDVRMKQTGLLPAGGYTWGASEIGLQRTVYEEIARELIEAPQTKTLLLEEMPNYDAYFAGMAMTADPHLKRILASHRASGIFNTNSQHGLIPADNEDGLRDPKLYNWNVPIEGAEIHRLLSEGGVLRLKFHGGKIERVN